MGPGPRGSPHRTSPEEPRADSTRTRRPPKRINTRRKDPPKRNRLQAATQGSKSLEVVSALFVDRTHDGILIKKMREAEG